MEWTKEQKQVIELRDRNMLVSAAAGSGKTAVLVERIIQRITDREHPVDVDRLLVVTFTNAAASEMRERIADAIDRELEQNTGDLHLLRQQSLIHNAQITTIDSFCLNIVRSYFHTIDLEPGFRIADEGELELLKEDVLDEVLEEYYSGGDRDFFAFMEAYGTAKSDQAVRTMIWDLFQNSQANPWPEEWLGSLDEGYRQACVDPDGMPWMKRAVTDYEDSMKGVMQELTEALWLTKDTDGPTMYREAIESDIACVQGLLGGRRYGEIAEALQQVQGFAKLKAARNYEGSIRKQEQVKAVREDMKKTVQEFQEKFFFQSKEELQASLERQQPVIHTLVELTRAFGDAYAAKKRKKNIVDFSDIEHFALEILVDRETREATDTAEEFQRFFVEVMIDEYQDSNYLQEAVLTAVSREQAGEPNRFMVGDVKQSIYRFRLARPELFMEKYETYTKTDSPCQKIELHQNFRSRDSVLETVNDIFYKIMGGDLGRITYDADTALYPGAVYPPLQGEDAAEVLLIETGAEGEKKSRNVLEAEQIAKRIHQLHGVYQVTDKKSGELRPVRYDDMVVLLRSPGSDAEEMASELTKAGIPAHAVSRTGYFSTMEIRVLLDYLSILDNPRQDIPMASVLSSWFGRLDKEELAQIRVLDREKPFYDNVLAVMEQAEQEQETGLPEPLQVKLRRFTEDYRRLRRECNRLPVHELLCEIFAVTGYLDYVTALPAGIQRKANVEMLLEKAAAFESTSYRGMFHFIRYIEKLQKYDVDFGEAEIVSENEQAVRIMSIHKSKGLEFPVCFVAGLGKRFNMADSRGKMVLHPELGIGLEECDGRRRLKSPSFVRQVLGRQVDLESLGEELRVLYVALTRAKEKLILVGGVKKAAERLEKYENQRSKGLLSYRSRTGASSYLDWILPALLSYGKKYNIEIYSCEPEKRETEEEIEKEIKTGLYKEELLERIRRVPQAQVQEIAERFSFCYPMEEEIALKAKVSVSELKHRAMVFEENEEVQWFAKEQPVPYVPAFRKEREENQGAMRGTAVHRAMECIDFALMEDRIKKAGVSGDPQGIRPIVEQRLLELLEMHKIDEQMHELIPVKKIAGFFSQEIAGRMSAAQRERRLFLEKPFVMGKEACEIYPEMKSRERVLIQGIVDVFFLEDEKVHILDYKTDRVEQKEQLINRYRTQIELYSEALARVFHVEAGEKIIYSFALEETIMI